MYNPSPTLESNKFLIRLMTENDKKDTFAAISDPLIWQQHPQNDRHTPEAFKLWFANALKGNAFVIIEKANSQIIGSSRYYEIDENLKHLSIGWTFLIRKHWGGETNRVIKRLMLEYAYQYVDQVWLHIATDNLRSRRAAEKIGCKLSHEGIKYGLPYCWYIAPQSIQR